MSRRGRGGRQQRGPTHGHDGASQSHHNEHQHGQQSFRRNDQADRMSDRGSTRSYHNEHDRTDGPQRGRPQSRGNIQSHRQQSRKFAERAPNGGVHFRDSDGTTNFTFRKQGQKRSRSETFSQRSPAPTTRSSMSVDTPVRLSMPPPRICKFFAQGRCRFGSACKFKHTTAASETSGSQSSDDSPPRKRPRRLEVQPPSPGQQECSFWKKGQCYHEACPYAHHVVDNPVCWRRASVMFCPFWAKHQSCPAGKECRFAHERVYTPMTGVIETGPPQEMKKEWAEVGNAWANTVGGCVGTSVANTMGGCVGNPGAGMMGSGFENLFGGVTMGAWESVM